MKMLICAIAVALSTAAYADTAPVKQEKSCHLVYKWLPSTVNGKISFVWKTVCDTEFPGAKTAEIPSGK